MANRLSLEKSPYLLQHANNPVNWFPWGEEAFRKAAQEDKPVFLSIGYATCHWCHVMERESFEDEEVAGILNENVISVKVDREERPDIDRIYMTVCQALTGSGGWPLSIFMTPDRKPFFAATYLPKSGRMGMAGLADVVHQIVKLWRSDRERLLKAGEGITEAIQPRERQAEQGKRLGKESLEAAYRRLEQSFDYKWGGFGSAPKFPTPHHLTFLLRWHKRSAGSQALSMVEKTLEAMRRGGLFDQVGFGFHRYSVDERWLVPHFEKMLYDQAMLAMAYIDAFQLTGNESHAGVAREIFEYVLRDMTSPEGGFYSAEDADSEGEEGRYYVWRPEEVKAVLGEERGEILCRFFDITQAGNFEHSKSIPHILKPPELFASLIKMDLKEFERMLDQSRRKLLSAREKRVHPLKDDKILTSWNGLMIVALARGYQALRNPDYTHAASRAADFILKTLRQDSGRLGRRYRNGSVGHSGCLDDYAFFIWALVELYQATFETRFLKEAIEIGRLMLDLFWDEEGGGGFFYTARDSEKLILRDKDIYDGATPSGNSIALLDMLLLSRMTGDTAWEEKAERMLGAFSGLVGDYPSGYTQFLNGLDFALGPAREIVIAGEREHEKTRAMIEALHREFSPNRVLMLREPGEEGSRLAALCDYVEALHPIDHQPAVYICENFACKSPVTDPAELAQE